MSGFNLSAFGVRERALTLFLIVMDRLRRHVRLFPASAAPRTRPSRSRS